MKLNKEEIKVQLEKLIEESDVLFVIAGKRVECKCGRCEEDHHALQCQGILHGDAEDIFHSIVSAMHASKEHAQLLKHCVQKYILDQVLGRDTGVDTGNDSINKKLKDILNQIEKEEGL